MTIYLYGFILAALTALFAGPARAGTEVKVLCEDIKKPFFRVSCDKDGNCTAFPQRAETLAKEFPVPKPAGSVRMFIIGESAAVLLGDGEEMSAGAAGFSMINCGMHGYESYRMGGVFDEVLNYQPDLIVLLSGNNEDGGYPCGDAAFRLRAQFRSLLEKMYSRRSGPVSAQARASMKLHRTRLGRMAAEAKKRKVPLLLCTLPLNLNGVPPSGVPPLESESFTAGLAAFEQKKFDRAAGLFAQSLKEEPRSLFSMFYMARAYEAMKKFKEAKDLYLRTLDADPKPGRAAPARNAMLRELAAGEGAGLCDLEPAFYNASRNGIPGLEQFSSAGSWRPAYNGMVLDEILKAAAALGLAAFKDLPAYTSTLVPPEEELKHDFTNALAAMDVFVPGYPASASASGGFLSEKTLAGIDFMESRWPGSLERTSLSAEAFKKFFLAGPWSSVTAARLEELRPQFLAHLAEAERRRGNNTKALALAARAIAADPERLYFRPVKALALAGLGRKPEAVKELSALYAAQRLRKRAWALGRARGLAMPDPAVKPAAEKDSKKLADDGTEKIRAGNPAAAERLLAGAVKLNPANAEAYLSLCAAQSAAKKFPAALESCDSARWGADSYYPDARKMLLSEASFLKAQVLAKLGRGADAAAELRRALQDPPAGWGNLEAAKAQLEKPAEK